MAVKCGAAHPEVPGRTCIRKGSHASHVGSEGEPWPNVEVREREEIRRKHPIRKPGGKSSLAAALGPAAEARNENLANEIRSFNIFDGKEDGMAQVATSIASEDFRRIIFMAMADVATQMERFSVNNAWDLLEARGYSRDRGVSAQVTGTIGRSGQGLGLWEYTGDEEENRSGNGHSKDKDVNVYRSKILGRDLEEFVDRIDAKVDALEEAAATRKANRLIEQYGVCEACGAPRDMKLEGNTPRLFCTVTSDHVALPD